MLRTPLIAPHGLESRSEKVLMKRFLLKRHLSSCTLALLGIGLIMTRI
jgi:hypothetical protein